MRKRWIVAAIALLLLFCVAAHAEVENIADRCRFWVSEGSATNVSDNSMGSAWKPKGNNPELRIKLPDEGAAWIQINWTYPPTNYTLTEYDANQSAISSHSAEDDSFACISHLLPLNANTRYISLSFSQEGQGINKVRVFPEGELPKTVIQWEKPLDKCDLLVVSTHEDDEWLWFGAIIPYYDLVKGKDVQVVYMANCGRYRYAEALNSIAVSGVRTYPHFVGLKDKRDDSLEEAVRTWTSKEHIVGVMAEVIRRFKPEVILTHDWDGEYGHPQHKLTSRCMEYAIAAAADPTQYPESAQKYGTWQVKKLYRHLEEKGRIEFDWHVAYLEFGGRTGIQVATDSMNEHASQLKYYQVKDHGQYDNALFGLSYSTVGDDVLHEDLFENVPESAPEATEAPAQESTEASAPESTEAPAPESTEAPEPESVAAELAQPSEEPGEVGETIAPEGTAAPTAAPASNSERTSGGGSALLLVAGSVAVAGCGIAYLLYTRRRMRRRRRAAARRRAAKGASTHGRPTKGATARKGTSAGTAGRGRR